MSTARFSVARDRQDAHLQSRTSPLAVFAQMDPILILCTIILGAVGIVALKGAVVGSPALEAAADRQVLFLLVGLVTMMAVALVQYRWINRLAMLLYGLNMVALIVVLFAGTRINGARSWIPLGPINWQPSETMKIAAVLVCAQWAAVNGDRLVEWRGLLLPGVVCGLPALLVLAQPDLGSASLFFLIFLTMMLMAGVPIRRLVALVTAAVLGMAAMFPMLKPYQRARLTSFLNPEADAAGAGYNVIQAKIAVGSGGLFGQGWGQGTQSIHRFLPESHTDFIFSSYAEQFGFMGICILIALYVVLFWRMVRAMDASRDRYGGLVVAGLMAIIGGHTIENIGMNMGLLPVTGIPLPFMSYGGSFLVTTCGLVGLVLNVASRRYVFTRD